jgi:hypothetical protein
MSENIYQITVNIYQIARHHVPIDSNLVIIEWLDMRHQKEKRGRRNVGARDISG